MGSDGMNKQTARTIADGLTWARLFSIIPISIFIIAEMQRWVLALYLLAALTDLLDGWFARRGTESKRGADLDGTVDLIFVGMTLVWIAWMIPGFYAKYWFPFLPAFVAFEGYFLFSRLRKKDLVLPHLWSGKIAMTLFCFLLPVLLVFGDVTWFLLLALYVPILAKAEMAVWIWRGMADTEVKSTTL